MELTEHLSQIPTGMKIDNEKDLQIKMIKYLSSFFTVYSEVWSTDDKRRIDLIIIHKSDFLRKFPIGIEIKIVAKKRGKDLGRWLIQASDYAKKDFRNFGKCLIVTCPQVSGYYLLEGELMNQHITEEGYSKDNNISTFLGQFGLGEFQKYFRSTQTLYRIVFKGQIIWDSYNDSFRPHNYERLCKL